MNIGETIKEHPWGAVAVLAIGAIILYALVSGGSSSAATTDGSGGPSENLQVAELNAASSMAQAQLAYKANSDQLTSAENIAALSANSDLLKTYSANDTALKVAGIQAGVQSKEIDAQSAMTIAQFKQLTDVAAIGAGVNLASISAARDTNLAETSALSDANKYIAALGAQTTQQANQLAAQTSQLASNNQTKVATQSSGGIFGGIIRAIGSIF